MEVKEPIIIKYRKKPIYAILKRLMDFFCSLLGLILLSWLMLIIAILVKCTSKGPVFYVSQRVGKNGKLFKFYKFRSMRVGADKELDDLLKYNETQGITFKMKDDPRITKFGKFLRKTSLDELPQLWNILNGSMSIVGPRPATPREVEQYNDYQRQRLMVKQGLTCIWQCSGRSNTTFDEQVDMDLKYINKRGFFYDIWLIIKTFFAVLFGKGAE
ncbi:MAG: sugar transferase [Erysipelotrichaceae bacterium]|nr:sugar transferase [Erysipelotrichaceae bacterium]